MDIRRSDGEIGVSGFLDEIYYSIYAERRVLVYVTDIEA
jgi:hypothetical protein